MNHSVFVLVLFILTATTPSVSSAQSQKGNSGAPSGKNPYHPSPMPIDPDASEEVKNLYNFLLYQFGDRIISGQTHGNYHEIKNLVGKSPMIRGGDFQHFTEGYPYLWKNGGHTFGKHDDGSVDSLINWYNWTRGKGIITYQWHWHSPTGGKAGTNTFYTNQTTFDISKAVIEGTPEYALILRDIDDIAAQLKRFQDAGIPILWRPLHEAGGGWFWWGAKGPEPCLKLYDILFDRLQNLHQLHNLLWVWSSPEDEWYPGNDKVDIIGHDSYPGSHNYGPQKTAFDHLFNLTKGEKIIAMTENGPIPNPDECFAQDAPWAYFMSWDNLATEQNSSNHLQEIFANPLVLTIESENYKTDNYWRSSLYPENWKPGFKDSKGRFLHDFSYAGYHKGELEIPNIQTNVIDVTLPPYNADNTGTEDVTVIIQDALNAAGESGGGVVFLPGGKYRISPPNGLDYALKIAYNNVILRGAGKKSTFLFNDEAQMRQKDVIRIQGDAWWFYEHESITDITDNLLFPTKVLPVNSVEGFKKGDRVIVRSDATNGFIEEHGMQEYWTESAIKGVAFLRKIDSVDVDNKLLFIDSPTRYFLKTRDNARVYHAGTHIKESGIEDLSIGNRQSIKSGWDEESYNEQGTGAYDAHFSHVIKVQNSINCWIKNVNTYHPDENVGDFHILSNCLLLNQCGNITVDSCFFQKPQYEGGGGNGYMFTLSSNDCLIKNSRANDSRHNYDFKYPYSNGNVIHNCRGENSKYASDFHMYLSMSNLIDVFTANGDYLESTFRPYGGSAIHGYSSTQSVFYNTIGESYHPNREYIIESKQYGWGYIIGTSGEAENINVDPAIGTINDYPYNTAPQDFYEGIGNGENLTPWSLYLDQLEKRLNNDSLQAYSLKIEILDKNTLEPVTDCTVKVFQQEKITGKTGIVNFENIPDMFILSIGRKGYIPVERKQIPVLSDTTLTFLLEKKEYNVLFRVLDKTTESALWSANVAVDNQNKITNSQGYAGFILYEGIYNFEISDDSYSPLSGTVEILSDTSFTFYLSATSAYVKFKLKNGSTPVNNATITIGNKTATSSALGISTFYNLPIDRMYEYYISKADYSDIGGSLLLKKDTTLTIQMTLTGFSEPDIKDAFSLWPNPTKDILYLNFSPGFLPGIFTISDLTGQIHFHQPISQNLTAVNISFLPSGIYIARFKKNGCKTASCYFIKN